jgi:hypothetical protein
VGGSLTLGGVLNVTDAGGFGTGVYTLVSYPVGSNFVYNGLGVGTVPDSNLVYSVNTNTVGVVALNVSCTGAAGAISGATAVCAGQNGVGYTVGSVSGATSYTWQAPAGASVVGGQGTTSITVNWGTTGGNVQVTPSNAGGCSGLPSSLGVTVNALPSVYGVTGGGAYCAGGSGVAVGLSGSESGVNYQLQWNGSDTGSPVAGTGSALSFGNQTLAGSYTAVASNATSGCGASMSGSASVALIPVYQCWQTQYFGCTNCPQADVNADPDGDGQGNQAEFLAGTDPTNSGSALRIISLVQRTTDVVITWATAGGRTNAVEASAGDGNGGYTTNSFGILNGQIILSGSGDTATNYTDLGGATNVPSRYYRIRLVP